MSGICFVCFLVGLKAKVTVMTKIKELGGGVEGGAFFLLCCSRGQVKSVYFNHPFSQISIL